MSTQPASHHAKHPTFSAMHSARTVLVLAFPGALLLNAAGPLEVFAAASRVLGGELADNPPYRVILASAQGGEIETISGIGVMTRSLAEVDSALAIDTLIVIGGPGVAELERDQQAIAWLQRRAPTARRLCSIGTGAFALAAAGLLDGRRVVTHWQFAEALQQGYPALTVEREALYLHDDRLWTCGGGAAGIDLGLALLEQDLGAQAALALARYFTVFLQRSAEQAQLSAPLKAQSQALHRDRDQRLVRLHAWIAANLNGDLRVERLAEKLGMSPRHFARAYAAATGGTPAQTVETLRLEAACRLLETSQEPIKRIAETTGFGNEERMRRSFQRQLGTSPLGYRSQSRLQLAR
ncbi:helix-turn-helix domain-containing protein [Pseudomonas sp. BIGb0427]|uniref:GlxA family transcriptional regulator n=1 Tax=unclassified Pseudomonas TaxID=196821 RepID=UPI0018A78897|nr:MULTISPECIES: helix-turn-helix domain-containing protein [unclassified Pseudomonas]QPG61806.1 helix-turn-helix domain-containing protein [Pseudomonas sp. BIGb0427]UVM69318.1 helix-turn-helix domain-containing protein [Pseudomonas sp. B21-009]